MGNVCNPCTGDGKHVSTFKVIPKEIHNNLLGEIIDGIPKDPSEQMQLTFKCSGLKKPRGDFDPMIVIYRCKDKKFKEVHQKEEFKTEAVL